MGGKELLFPTLIQDIRNIYRTKELLMSTKYEGIINILPKDSLYILKPIE